MGKGEKNYEQFLLFPQCFQKTCTADTQKPGLVWERVKKYLVGSLEPTLIAKRTRKLMRMFVMMKSGENVCHDEICFMY